MLFRSYNNTDYNEIHNNKFNPKLFHFNTNDLYYDFILNLNKNNFEIFKVIPYDKNLITVIVKVKNHDN